MLQISKIFAKNDYPTLLFMILPVLAFIMLSIFSPVHFLFLIGAFALTALGYRLAALWSARRETQQIALVRQQLITRWQSYKEIGH
jgi:ABC-type transport system involved in cytochrome bd biosynthesis fused ATPase/permease subunit